MPEIVSSLNDRGITIIFHKENLIFSHDIAQSAMNKLMFQMLAAFAEFERSMIRERQREGINKANEPYRVCRRPSFLRECPDDKIKIYP